MIKNTKVSKTLSVKNVLVFAKEQFLEFFYKEIIQKDF
jgi:hypothetical protein